MNSEIKLAPLGVRLFYATLETHDFLWFASHDMSGISATEVVVHNYALTYALSRFERGLVVGQTPAYDLDLQQMPLYATAADRLADNSFAAKVRFTWNAMDTRTQRTADADFSKRNTPMMGRRVVIAPMTRFGFYVFTFDGTQPPGAIRLGKKRCPCRVRYGEILGPVARRTQQPCVPTHLVNPLDVGGKVEAFEAVNIPPHMLLRSAHLRDDYVVLHRQGKAYHVVQVPCRVLTRVGAA